MRVPSFPVLGRQKSTRQLLGAGLSLAFSVAAISVLWFQIKEMDLAQVATLFQQISVWQWALAVLATIVSFVALGRYDAFWHAALKTGVKPLHARRSGMAAIAIGQTVGLASVSSSLIRWRCLPQLAPLKIAALTAAVGFSFLIVWAICAVVAAWYLMAPLAGFDISGTVVFCFALGISACLWISWQRTALRLTDIARLVAWVLIDIAAAASVLWILLPIGTDLSWAPLLAGFTLALGAGILCNSPGGVGPFELVLLTALPSLPADAALSAVLGYRLIYFLLPFVIAVIFAVTLKSRPSTQVSGPADWGLARQSGRMTRFGESWAHVLAPLPGLCVALGNPEPHARSQTGVIAPPKGLRAIYKSDARLAASARAKGWTCSLIAREAVLNPQNWSLTGSKMARLRQALRKGDAACVETIECRGDLPLHEMTHIAKSWSRAHGGELAATMGVFEPNYIREQRVFLIYVAQELRGFLTFHAARDWSLDLIRHDAGLPKGAIQAAVVAAIETAKTEEVTRFSLAAIPAEDGALSRWCKSKAGLAQFKRQFAPDWEPRYMITRTKAEHLVYSIALYFAVQRPMYRNAQRIMHQAHDRLAKFEFASFSRTRDSGSNTPQRT